MSEHLFSERKRLRSEYFRMEKQLRDTRESLEQINRQIAKLAPASLVQLPLALDAPDLLAEIPSGPEDEWASLAREPVPDTIEVILHRRSPVAPPKKEIGNGKLFAETIMAQFNLAAEVSILTLIDALRVKFPSRNPLQIRAQVNIVLRRLRDQQRIRKVRRGAYTLVPAHRTVALSRLG